MSGAPSGAIVPRHLPCGVPDVAAPAPALRLHLVRARPVSLQCHGRARGLKPGGKRAGGAGRSRRGRHRQATRCALCRVLGGVAQAQPDPGHLPRRPALQRPIAELPHRTIAPRKPRIHRTLAGAYRGHRPRGPGRSSAAELRHLREERERFARRRAFPRPSDADQPIRQYRRLRRAARLRQQRAAVQDRAGLRELAEARREAARNLRSGHRQHARRHAHRRGAAESADAESAAAIRRADLRSGGQDAVLGPDPESARRVQRRRQSALHRRIQNHDRERDHAGLQALARFHRQRVSAGVPRQRRHGRAAGRRSLVHLQRLHQHIGATSRRRRSTRSAPTKSRVSTAKCAK
jgi:hypothetical protein